MVVYQLLPFRDNEYGVSHRHALLQNFVKVKKELTFWVVGNNSKMKMFVQMPRSLESFFKSNFFAAFPTSDLIQHEESIPTPSLTYIHIDNKAEIATKDFFVKDGAYIDPMKDIMTTYSSISKK